MKYKELPIISGRLGEILALNGFINAEQTTKIFFQVLEGIKNITYDIRWRYKLPCLMMMWKIFKKGAIFEMPKPDVAEKESTFWSFLSELFMFIRPRLPLDGLIFTLPVDMLLSKSSDIETYAKDLFAKIFA